MSALSQSRDASSITGQKAARSDTTGVVRAGAGDSFDPGTLPMT
jgi:hypothetical protein